MGGGQSTLMRRNTSDSSLAGEERCQLCFPFCPPGQSDDDLMGSPMPDTPEYQREKRKEVISRALNDDMRDDPTYSSKYMGLEKEVVPSQRNLGNGHQTGADVYEGQDAESILNSKYDLLEVLGVGSTSTCHRCVSKSSGIHYACKVIDKRLIEDRFQGMMDQFHAEIEALRSLQHPNIIQLLDVFISEEKIFIVMELMEGGELFDYVVQKGTLTEEEASRIVRSVTGALVYMHSKNIVHRDLKPENLMLRQSPRHSHDPIEVKIIDFGLSKCMEEPVARSFLGTRGYLAPEMLQRREYTRAVDTWALGVIVFVLLCGCLPFDDDSQTVPTDDLVRAKFVLRFPRWAGNLSASAKDLLAKLLDVNPSSRYTAEMALEHPWVMGKTAPKGNMLASPGRIKKSPVLKNRTPNQGRGNNNGRYRPARAQNSPISQDSPKRVMVRKTSI